MSIGVISPMTKFVAVEFDPYGNYVRTLTRGISEEALSSDKSALTRWQNYWDELDLWAAELGLTQDVIAVKKFSFPELDLRIQDLPPIWQEMVDNGEEIDEQTKEEITSWQEWNYFVLVWGQDYDIDEEGEVVST